jgi:hypothetical protein
MINGVMSLWFVLTALSVIYVAIDVRRTPESSVLKWGFVLITVYMGPAGAFLYVLGCREPLPGLHERYVAVRWRQVLGSTMHCVAGDGAGILAGAVLAGFLHLPVLADIALEYALGFGFGWTVFQALFMRDMAGGSYVRALGNTFIPELVSMNALMAGMVPIMTTTMANLLGAHSAVTPAFWFVMSMALLTGFLSAYPMNWWLVARGLKHGMMTVRPALAGGMAHADHFGDAPAHDAAPKGRVSVEGHAGSTHQASITTKETALMTLLSFILLALGLGISYAVGGLVTR